MVRTEVFNKLRNFEITQINAQPNVDAAKGRVAAGELPEQALSEAIEQVKERCLRAKRWCSEERDAFLRELNDPPKEFTEADLKSRQQFCADAEDLLRKLETDLVRWA
jgi:hypothetical protein